MNDEPSPLLHREQRVYLVIGYLSLRHSDKTTMFVFSCRCLHDTIYLIKSDICSLLH